MTIEYRIQPFHSRYIDEIITSFIESFDGWNHREAEQYVMQAFLAFPDICFVAIDTHGACAGAIFCKEVPYQCGTMCCIEALQVIQAYRKHGIGKSLLATVIDAAKRKHISVLGMLSPSSPVFPLCWYEHIGFRRTGWIELTANIDDIHT